MQAGIHKLYLVKWKGLPNSDNYWMAEKKLMKYIQNSSKIPMNLNEEFQNFLAMGGCDANAKWTDPFCVLCLAIAARLSLLKLSILGM